MVTRREVVTTGALGALATAAEATGVGTASGGGAATMGAAAATAQSPEVIVAQALRDLAEDVNLIRLLLRDGLIGPSLSQGAVADLRRQFTTFLRANQKYPDYCEIGPGIFTDVYDWHVRYQQPVEMSRVDNRTALRFMFTWLILRPEQTDGFIGIPFDRA